MESLALVLRAMLGRRRVHLHAADRVGSHQGSDLAMCMPAVVGARALSVKMMLMVSAHVVLSWVRGVANVISA